MIEGFSGAAVRAAEQPLLDEGRGDELMRRAALGLPVLRRAIVMPRTHQILRQGVCLHRNPMRIIQTIALQQIGDGKRIPHRLRHAARIGRVGDAQRIADRNRTQHARASFNKQGAIAVFAERPAQHTRQRIHGAGRKPWRDAYMRPRRRGERGRLGERLQGLVRVSHHQGDRRVAVVGRADDATTR